MDGEEKAICWCVTVILAFFLGLAYLSSDHSSPCTDQMHESARGKIDE